MKIICAHCGKAREKAASHVNRARRAGLRIFCGRRCSGLSKCSRKSKAQKREEKRFYDAQRRTLLADEIKAAKAAYHKRTYDPAKAKIGRKRRMPWHVEYCRRPEYRRWKHNYDRRHRASKFGPFAEVYLLTVDLNREIKSRSSNYEIRQQNNTINKRQTRARDEGAQATRDRHRAAPGE